MMIVRSCRHTKTVLLCIPLGTLVVYFLRVAAVVYLNTVHPLWQKLYLTKIVCLTERMRVYQQCALCPCIITELIKIPVTVRMCQQPPLIKTVYQYIRPLISVLYTEEYFQSYPVALCLGIFIPLAVKHYFLIP